MIKHIKRRMSLGKARSSKSEEVHAFVLNLRKPMGLTAKDKTLIISTIDKNGQADKGGLQIGDVITSVGGIDVKNIGDVQASLANFRKKVRVKSFGYMLVCVIFLNLDFIMLYVIYHFYIFSLPLS